MSRALEILNDIHEITPTNFTGDVTMNNVTVTGRFDVDVSPKYINVPQINNAPVTGFPNETQLNDRVLVIQGGSQTTCFSGLAVPAAQKGAHVYALSRTRYWFEFACELHNRKMFSKGLPVTEGVLSGDGTIDNPLVFSFPNAGSITWLRTDCRTPNVEWIDEDYETQSGYTNAKLRADTENKPYLTEQLFFQVSNEHPIPSLSTRGALSYVMQKHGYISEIMINGGADNVPKLLENQVQEWIKGAGSNIKVASSPFATTLKSDFIGIKGGSVKQAMIDLPNDDPTYESLYFSRKTYNYSTGTVLSQIFTRSNMVIEGFQAVLQNDNSHAAARFGILSSASGNNEAKEATRFSSASYNVGSWNLSDYYAHQIHHCGQHRMISSFHVSVGGLFSKSLGFPTTFNYGAWKGKHALDMDAYTRGEGVKIIPKPLNHLERITSDTDYAELHRALKFKDGRWMMKNYAKNALSDDSYEDMLSTIDTYGMNSLFTNFLILYGAGNDVIDPTTGVVNPNPTRYYFPLGLEIIPWVDNMTIGMQNNGITNAYGSQDPFELGKRIFDFFYNNVPFLSGHTFDIDQFWSNNGLSNAIVARNSNDASAGLLENVMPTTVDGAVLTPEEFDQYLSIGTGYTSQSNPYKKRI